jgi:multiple sugar transport system substrate-binding protein
MTFRYLAALVACALFAAACGGGAAGDTGDQISLVLFGDPVEVAGYERMIAAFEDANPDVDVALTPVAKQDDLLAKLTTSFAAGAPPDVFLVNFRKYGQFAEQGALEPVESYLAASEEIDVTDFYTAAFDAFRYDGETLTCMPQNLSSLEVYYNVDLFEQAGLDRPEAGWTWDDFLAAAQALTTAETYGVGVEPSLIRVAPFVWSAGGEVVDDPIDPTRLTLGEGKAREALDWFLDLSLVHGVVPPDVEEQSEESEARFLRGALGMYLNSRKSVPTLRTIEGFEWDVAPLPVAPGGEPATILHADAYCMSASGNHDAAWRLIEFAMSEQGQIILAESGRTVPSRKDVANSPVFLDPDVPPAHSEVFIEAAEYLRATPHVASWSRVEKEADKILEEIFYGRVPRDQGIAELIADTTPLFGGDAG